MTPIQLRIDGAEGYGLPLVPRVLAELNEFEVGHVLACLDLDPEQRRCAHAAIEAVQAGRYPASTRKAA